MLLAIAGTWAAAAGRWVLAAEKRSRTRFMIYGLGLGLGRGLKSEVRGGSYNSTVQKRRQIDRKESMYCILYKIERKGE